MYIPHHYKNENLSEIKAFIEEHGFGILINQTDGRPWATHTPLELEVNDRGEDVLVGHIAKANAQSKSFAEDAEVLVIFNGPHTYISSSWYRDEEVPTWDYIAVHIYGRLEILPEDAVLASLHRLVSKYEKNSKTPISLHDLSPKTMRQIKGIVGFQIKITEIKAAYKLSQGREHDHPEIIKQLEEGKQKGAKAIAAELKKRLS